MTDRDTGNQEPLWQFGFRWTDAQLQSLQHHPHYHDGVLAFSRYRLDFALEGLEAMLHIMSRIENYRRDPVSSPLAGPRSCQCQVCRDSVFRDLRHIPAHHRIAASLPVHRDHLRLRLATQARLLRSCARPLQHILNPSDAGGLLDLQDPDEPADAAVPEGPRPLLWPFREEQVVSVPRPLMQFRGRQPLRDINLPDRPALPVESVLVGLGEFRRTDMMYFNDIMGGQRRVPPMILNGSASNCISQICAFVRAAAASFHDIGPTPRRLRQLTTDDAEILYRIAASGHASVTVVIMRGIGHGAIRLTPELSRRVVTLHLNISFNLFSALAAGQNIQCQLSYPPQD